MPALARVQVQVQGRGGQGSSDWLVGRWKNTKEREVPTPHQGQASRNTGLEASSVPPVSGTKHSRVDGPGSTFKTHLNLGKPRVLAEPFFKGKKKEEEEEETTRGESAQRSVHYSGAAVAIGSAALGWHLSPHTAGAPALPPGSTPTPIFLARQLFSPVKPPSL